MMDKVRFLWTKPYNSMRIDDIIRKLYPESPKDDFNGKYSDLEVVDPASREPADIPESDTIILEDFLNQGAVKSEEKNFEEHLKKAYTKPCVATCAESAVSNGPDALDGLLVKLRKDISEYEKKIRETKDKIAAVLTVKQLMATEW